MITFEGIDENFKFLVMDVDAQAKAVRRFLEEPNAALHDKIVSRDDYIDNLKTIIENKCFSRINADVPLDARQLNKIRAIQVISVNLERIADFLVNVARQTAFLDDPAFLRGYGWEKSFDVIQKSLGMILTAFRKEDMAKALAVCKAENDLDRLYKEAFDRILAEMGQGGPVGNLITALFIFRYFERVGDSVLNIGEAVIFSILGERIKIEQFEALQKTLTKSGFAASVKDIDFKAIWGARSGCRIGRVGPVGEAAGDRDRQSIYKEGVLEKIRRENANIGRWKSLFPGLVAEVFGLHEDEATGKGAMLVEFLPGCTLDEVILSADEEIVRNALFVLEQTVRHVWTVTLRPGPIAADYMEQVRARLGGVLQTYPEFKRPPLRMGSVEIASSEELLTRCREIEAGLSAPFSVFTHGDFNCNNIVYDHEAQQIRYIDLYRSRDYDYVQDVSIFLVSNFRMPVFEAGLRKRIDLAADQFLAFAAAFAAERRDATFAARLALGLARAFYTSTRFELNFRFAKTMFHRSMFLMERLCAHAGEDWQAFSLPENILRL